MSAKSSTFAAEMKESMDINEMTHTAWRCRHSLFVTRLDGLRCLKHCEEATDERCKKCDDWGASEIAEQYFDGTLKGDLKNIVSSIMLERKREGRF